MKTYILNEQLILLTTFYEELYIGKEFNSCSLVGEKSLCLQDEVELLPKNWEEYEECIRVNATLTNGHYIIRINNMCDDAILLREITNIIPYNFSYFRINYGSEINNTLILNRNIPPRSPFDIDIEGELLSKTQTQHSITLHFEVEGQRYAKEYTFLFPEKEIREEVNIEEVKRKIVLQFLLSDNEAYVGDTITSVFKISLVDSPIPIKLKYIENAILPFAKKVEIEGPFERIGNKIKLNTELQSNMSIKVAVSFQVSNPLKDTYEPILQFEVAGQSAKIPFKSEYIEIKAKKE